MIALKKRRNKKMILQNKIRLISTYIIICKYYFNQSNICFLILKSVTTILLNFSISSYCKGYCQSLLTVFRLSTLEGTSMLHSCFMHLDTHLYCWTHFTQNNASWYRGYRSNCESVTHYTHLWALAQREVCLAVRKDTMERILPLIHYFIQLFFHINWNGYLPFFQKLPLMLFQL